MANYRVVFRGNSAGVIGSFLTVMKSRLMATQAMAAREPLSDLLLAIYFTKG
jgi:hypothetical protein